MLVDKSRQNSTRVYENNAELEAQSFDRTRLMIVKRARPKTNHNIFHAKNNSIPLTINLKNSDNHKQNLLTKINRQVNSSNSKKSPSPGPIENNYSMFVQRASDEFLERNPTPNPEESRSCRINKAKQKQISYYSYYNRQIQRQIANTTTCVAGQETQKNEECPHYCPGLSKMLRISKYRPNSGKEEKKRQEAQNKSVRCRCQNKSQEIKRTNSSKKHYRKLMINFQNMENQQKPAAYSSRKIRYSELKRLVNGRFLISNTDLYKPQPKTYTRNQSKSPRRLQQSWKVESWQQGNQNSKFLQLSSSKNLL